MITMANPMGIRTAYTQFYRLPLGQSSQAPLDTLVDSYQASSSPANEDFLTWRGRMPVAAATTTAPQTASESRLEVGQQAADWGVDRPQQNPNTGNADWSNYSLGWARRGLESASGRELPLLQAADSKTAFARCQRAGKIRHGNPPQGAVVFVPSQDGQYKVGFANADGKTFRTTVSKQVDPSTLGDRPLPQGDVAWMMPPAAEKTEGGQKAKPSKDHGKSSEIGLKARDWGYKKGKINPNTGNTSWGGYCLGWARRAVEHAAGRSIPLLHNESAKGAYAQLRRAGKVHFGNPPAGALVFWDSTNSKLGAKYGHVAIVNPNGKSYRGASSENFGKTHHVGDRAFTQNERKHIGWVMPEELLKH